jgi:surfeit locus 1 family protein
VSLETRRFPWGLTLAAATAFAVLVGLGVWQVHRLQWKEALLAKIAALAHAPARPLASVVATGGAVEFMRVETLCEPGPRPARSLFRYAVRDGRIGWRLLGVCRLAAGPYDGVIVDRGVIERFMGATSPQAASFPAPASVSGVIRGAGAAPLLGPAVMEQSPAFVAYRMIDRASLASIAASAGLARPAPWVLAAEHETPPLAGVTPAALPQDIPNNHLAYALTWFALAAILAWFYGAMLIRGGRR